MSMPYVGLTSFLLKEHGNQVLYELGCVNALCRAHIISTAKIMKKIPAPAEVSMPYVGLTSFLPYPFKTSVFMRVSCPVFSCIFLNFQIFWYNKAKKWAKLRLYF